MLHFSVFTECFIEYLFRILIILAPNTLLTNYLFTYLVLLSEIQCDAPCIFEQKTILLNMVNRRMNFTRNIGAPPNVHVVHDDRVVKDRFESKRQLTVDADVLRQPDAEAHVRVSGCGNTRCQETQRLLQRTCRRQNHSMWLERCSTHDVVKLYIVGWEAA